MITAQQLNADGQAAKLNKTALEQVMHAQGERWYQLASASCQFSFVPVFINAAQLQQMQAVIEAVERVVRLEKWNAACRVQDYESAKGVFYGYDFHLNSDGAHLIEINTNAGGAFINALLIESQNETELPGVVLNEDNLELIFIEMFRREWLLARGDVPLSCIAIVDERPQDQHLYPEFLLAQRIFERAGISAHIVDPADIESRTEGLYCNGERVDMLYNRLTDFSLQHYPELLHAGLTARVVLTPSPEHYLRYADKRNLARLSNANVLHELAVNEDDIATLLAGVPKTREVGAADREQWRADRKKWFFKPNSGYGSRGSYNGTSVTTRVFDEIMQGGYVAQRLAKPGTRVVCDEQGEPQLFKFDVRCYVYEGKMQMIVARLYQGQTTNFRTPGGGFALVRVVDK